MARILIKNKANCKVFKWVPKAFGVAYEKKIGDKTLKYASFGDYQNGVHIVKD